MPKISQITPPFHLRQMQTCHNQAIEHITVQYNVQSGPNNDKSVFSYSPMDKPYPRKCYCIGECLYVCDLYQFTICTDWAYHEVAMFWFNVFCIIY